MHCCSCHAWTPQCGNLYNIPHNMHVHIHYLFCSERITCMILLEKQLLYMNRNISLKSRVAASKNKMKSAYSDVHLLYIFGLASYLLNYFYKSDIFILSIE